MNTKRLTISLIVLLILALGPTRAHALNFYLSPQASTVNTGDIFGVDIGFNNNTGVLLNGAVVTFGYDENYLELQDTDAGNLLGTGSGPDGANIMDANHFSGWNTNLDVIDNQQQNWITSHPFAVHYEVIYTTDATRDGIFGRAYFKALKPTAASTSLAFGPYYGLDEGVYIDPSFNVVQVTGNTGADINVVPEPASLILMGTGLLAAARVKRG
jgi:hypothetical protein